MDCPQCRGYQLKPFELEPGLVACQCPKCSGTLLPLMNYRYWAEQQPEPVPAEQTLTEVEDSQQVKLCPKCACLMSKFTIGVEAKNRLELCNHCYEAWLDDGEWQLLKQLGLTKELTTIFTDGWQRKIRQQQHEANLKERYKKILGEEDFARIDEFKQWLVNHPEEAQIRQYLLTQVQ